MKIYVVTSGCYSDYGIDAVFVDKKEAAKFAAVKNKDNNYRDEDVGKILEHRRNDGVKACCSNFILSEEQSSESA